MDQEYRKDFFDFLKKGTSPYHVTAECERRLKEAGFGQLQLSDTWTLERGKSYYVKCHDSTLFAFTLGRTFYFHQGARIVAAHVDFPGLRIKAKPEMNVEGYQKLNVEVYGGPILNTWLDRPLSVSGRVALRSDDVFHPRMELVDFERPIATIPNLAIHINREVNKGVELNRQQDMLPLLSIDLSGEKKEKKENEDFFLQALARRLDVAPSDVLDYELGLYNVDEPTLMGLEEEFISSPRLDNLTSTYAALQGLLATRRDKGINMVALFDHEEIGSKTKQGAASQLLAYVLEKICMGCGQDHMQYLDAVTDSIMLSLDVSHGLHPNKVDQYDPTNKPVLNGGVCVKEACSQSYATDSHTIGIVRQICEKENIPFQKSVNRSDKTGGSTLGAIAGTLLPMQIADVGIPLLAMHSARELMGVKDQDATQKLVERFFAL